MGIGDWGLRIGDWGLGSLGWGVGPNAHSHNPQSPLKMSKNILLYIIINYFLN